LLFDRRGGGRRGDGGERDLPGLGDREAERERGEREPEGDALLPRGPPLRGAYLSIVVRRLADRPL